MLLNPSSLHLTRGLPRAGFILSSYFPIAPVVLRNLACGADRNNKLIRTQAQPYQSLNTPRYCRAASTVQQGSNISSTSSKKVAAAMAPAARPDLEKQYMSSTPSSKKQNPEPRPSSSILLISPDNEILLLRRVQTSSSFASAHVFPGGNLSSSQDGEIPSPSDKKRHVDGPAYRLGAIRECFEESGLLLAKKKGDQSGELLEIDTETRDKARKDIHAGKLKFTEWVESIGGVVDSDSLIPFTRWITPANLPKRFTTQMYVYFLPLTQSSPAAKTVIHVPTSDGGLEHTTALFAPCTRWLDLASRNEIILFPPQFYLINLLCEFLTPSSAPLSTTELQAQRTAVMRFLETDGDGRGVKWADKVMSPVGLLFRKSDGRSVLGLDKPGPELEGSGRRGDEKRVVLVKFGKGGPRDVEVRMRQDVLDEERAAAKLKL